LSSTWIFLFAFHATHQVSNISLVFHATRRMNNHVYSFSIKLVSLVQDFAFCYLFCCECLSNVLFIGYIISITYNTPLVIFKFPYLHGFFHLHSMQHPKCLKSHLNFMQQVKCITMFTLSLLSKALLARVCFMLLVVLCLLVQGAIYTM